MTISEQAKAEIAAFVKERNEVLLSGDVDRVISFHEKHNPGVSFPTREIAEMAMHKARTAVKTLPFAERLKSKRWLRDHGSASFDDGELTDS